MYACLSSDGLPLPLVITLYLHAGANTVIGGGQQLASGASTLAGGAVGKLEGAAGTAVSGLHKVEDLANADSQGNLSADQPQSFLLARQTARPLGWPGVE